MDCHDQWLQCGFEIYIFELDIFDLDFRNYVFEKSNRCQLSKKVFISSFLIGCLIKPHEKSPSSLEEEVNITCCCQLYKLNKLGKYGSLQVKQLIGEYAGLQHGLIWGTMKFLEKFKHEIMISSPE
jgi:hypothetical protein